MATPDRLASLGTGLTLLDTVTSRGSIGMRALAETVELPLSTTYRYVGTLVSQGYLLRVDGRVMPGPKLAAAPGDDHLVSLASDVLRGLVVRTGMTALLTVRVQIVGMCLDHVTVRGGPRIAFVRGELQPLYAGASVTPLLAYAPPAVVDQVLEQPLRRFTAASPTADQVRAELPRIRDRGFAASHGERTPGASALGVPVLRDGRPLCVLSLVGPSARFADVAPLLERLRHAAHALGAAAAASADPWSSDD